MQEIVLSCFFLLVGTVLCLLYCCLLYHYHRNMFPSYFPARLISLSLLYGLPKYQLSKLPRVMNASARLVHCAPKSCHITPLLHELHWLPVCYRIEYKIILLTFKVLHGMAPDYLCHLISDITNPRNSETKHRNTETAKHRNDCFRFPPNLKYRKLI